MSHETEAATPPFAYYGGKMRLAAAIARTFPPHQHYVEPFAGSLAVLLAKARSRMETVNDADRDLMLFWRVLRDRPAELTEAAALTPHSRAEHAAAYDLDGADGEVERARRVWVLLTQGRGGSLRRTGWRFYRDPVGSSFSMPDYLTGYVRRIPACARRLHGVSLESRDALEVIRDYGRHPEVLLYVDPPYLGSARSSLGYRIEFDDPTEHEELAAALHDCKAAVVLSGYPSPLYDRMFAGWRRTELPAWTGNGLRNGHGRDDGVRVEHLWCNRAANQPTLFDTVTAQEGARP